MAGSTLSLDLQVAVVSWQRTPRLKTRLLTAAQATLEHLPLHLRLCSSATVLLTGNARIKQLNRDFRGIDQATNVLSFPQFSPEELRCIRPKKTVVELGDIALAYQYVVAEAKRDNKVLIDHVTHLVIHGLLHLFGYDHVDEALAGRMEKLESEIMKDLGLQNPYE